MDLPLLLISLLVFTGTFLPIYVIFRNPVPPPPPANRRIARAMGADRPTVFEQPLLVPFMSVFLDAAGRLNLPKLRKDVRQDLNGSGNVAGYSVEQYLALCLMAATAAAFLGGLGELLLGGGLLLFVMPVMAAVGFYIPLMVLRSARERRVVRIAKQLPYTLDLIALVMAAGSSFQEAIQTLIRDDPQDDFNQELALTLSEMDYGATRAQSLANLAERVPLETLRSVVAAVNQSEQLGTPMASILKVQADMLRAHRGVIAERKSASASLRILIPSMMIMISVITIVFAPMIIRYLKDGLL